MLVSYLTEAAVALIRWTALGMALTGESVESPLDEQKSAVMDTAR